MRFLLSSLLLFPLLSFAQQSNMVLLPTQQAPSMTAAERAKLYFSDTYNTGLIFSTAIPAATSMANPPKGLPRSWRQGPGGYGRHVGDFMASQISADTTRHLTAALLHEDPRYRRSQNKGFFPRFGHALASQFLTWDASGSPRPAFNTLAGVAAAGFVRTAYAPAGFDDTPHALQRSRIYLGRYVVESVIREFGPELCRTAQKMKLTTGKACL